MKAQTGLPNDHPMMKAWNAFQSTDEFMSALRWCNETKYDDGREIDPLQREQHAKGSLWLAFTKGMEVNDEAICLNLDALRQERDSLKVEHDRLKEENVKLKQKVWGLEQAVEIVRARSFEQQIEDLERQVKIAVEALEKFTLIEHADMEDAYAAAEKALSEIAAEKEAK